jgi:hypothetical protein
MKNHTATVPCRISPANLAFTDCHPINPLINLPGSLCLESLCGRAQWALHPILIPAYHDPNPSSMTSPITVHAAHDLEERPSQVISPPPPPSPPSGSQASTSPLTDATTPSSFSRRKESASLHQQRTGQSSSETPSHSSVSLVAQAGGPVYYFQRGASTSQKQNPATFSQFCLLNLNGDPPDKLIISSEQVSPQSHSI